MSMSRLDQLLSRRHFVIGSSALAAATLSGGLWGCASDEPLGSTGPSDSPDAVGQLAEAVVEGAHASSPGDSPSAASCEHAAKASIC